MKSSPLATLVVFFSIATGLFPSRTAHAASLEPTTGYVNSFATQPPVADWASFSRAGTGTNDYNSDMDVNTNITVSGVTSLTVSNANNPASQNPNATWSSTGQYLQTRPTQNRYTALLGKFVNNTGTNATQVTLSYLFTFAGTAVAEDYGKGNRVYYSHSGLANSWVNLEALNTTNAALGSTNISLDIPTSWPIGSNLFLLWIDDNGAVGNDTANQIDNFSLQVTAGAAPALGITLTAPGGDSAFVAGGLITATAETVYGIPPLTVEYFTNNGTGDFGSAGSATTAPYSVGLIAPGAGTYNIYAVVTDSSGGPARAFSMTNAFLVANPLAVTLTAPDDGATFDQMTAVLSAAMVSGGTPPFSVQFQVDDAPNGAPVTSPPYERNLGTLPVGPHAIRATATDARGWVSNSIVRTVSISGPLAVSLNPTNGASLLFGEPVTLAAAPVGGTAPYTVTFALNDQSFGPVSAPPYTVDLGILPVDSYTGYVHVADSSIPAQQARSTTNVFSILPNPIVVTVTSPTNGQTIAAGQALPLTATAGVEAPLTVTNVEFFVDDVSVGRDSSAPYASSYPSPTAGAHRFYVVATDSLGRSRSSITNQATVPGGGGPPNDFFENAIPLNGPVVTGTGSNVGATKQFGGEPTFIAGSFGGGSVWWTWLAVASGPTTIDTMGSDFNTLLGVFTGNVANQLALVADNDNFAGNTWSRVQFNAVAGTTYRIVVDGFRTGGGPGGQAARGNIRLNVMGPGGVQLDSPAHGTQFTAGDPIPVSVSITPDFPSPPATRVDFYRNGMIFASATNAPFSVMASNTPTGSNTFYAVAINSAGTPIQSPVATVVVLNVGVTLLSPADGAVFLNTNPITVAAGAALLSGAISKIEFFVDGEKFGEAATPPYTAVWSNVVGGSHRFTAVGTSDTGDRYNSQPVNIAVAQILIPFGSVWRYLDNGTDQGTAWVASTFDDSAWKSGPAELGYGDGDEATVVEDNPTPGYTQNATDRYITTYFRYTLAVSNTAGLQQLRFAVERDDGAVIFLNGQEIFRSANMPAAPAPITYLTATSDGIGSEDTIDAFTLSPTNLVPGANVVAVEIHQQNATSSDVSFNLELLGVPPIIRNDFPLVTLVDPTNNASFVAPSVIPLEATASDTDGSVVRVAFYADGLWLGETTNAPYRFLWNNPPVGAYTLTAVATDNENGASRSAPVAIVVYDAARRPVAEVVNPPEGGVFLGPTNLTLAAIAFALEGVTNVQFLVNGALAGSDATPPYTIPWASSFGSNGIVAIASDTTGARGTSPVVRITVTIPPTNTVAPFVRTQVPLAGSAVTNTLTSIRVFFSERVQNVNAADLLINGLPATNVTGTISNFLFSFPQPAFGPVNISWATGHGITDFGFPSDLPFDELAPGAQWQIELRDRIAPTLTTRVPAAGSFLNVLTNVMVTFSKPVSGVDAGDLLVAGVPAYDVSGSGASYNFFVSQPPSGVIPISWVTNHGITDQAITPNAFNGASTNAIWNVTLDSRTILLQSNGLWRFVKATGEASDPPTAWRSPGFIDTGWSNAPAPFFYGDPYSNGVPAFTHLTDMQSNYTGLFLRREFTLTNASVLTNLFLAAAIDDGFIVWVNGVQVFRFNVPAGELPYTATAITGSVEPTQMGAGYISYNLTNAPATLVNGVNVIAIHALNQAIGNNDFGFNAQLFTYLSDAPFAAPRLVQAAPAPGDLLSFSSVALTFSEPVGGVDAGDLLVNGLPASTVSSTDNTTYVFGFPPPSFGDVVVSWAVNHGIRDFDDSPKPFNGTAASSILRYTLNNPSSPRIMSQIPAAGSTVTGLTSIVLTFTEAVGGLDAADLLVSGAPANTVSSLDNVTFTFGFAQPRFGPVPIRWATNHGIQDVEMPANPFDPTRFGGQWDYTLIDPIPTVILTSPVDNAAFQAPAGLLLSATATDNDGTIARVEFYEGADKLGESTTAPYTLGWSNVAVGEYVLRAVATDDTGLTATSAPARILVIADVPVVLRRGPYLQSGSSTGAVVRWRTDLASDVVVRYGTDPAALSEILTVEDGTNEHIIRLTGLQPDTQYYYSIGSPSQRLAGGTNYWFRTAPIPGTPKPVRFWVLGDPGTANDNQRNVRNAFYAHAAASGPADFWLMLGDNAYNSGTDAEHQAAVFDMYPTTLRNLFLWPTIGNHETDQSTTIVDFPYLHIFSLPQNGESGGIPSGTERYYAFDYGNIHFICLDSMSSGRTTNTAMARWLIDDLAATTADWIVVYFHHPPYTRGSHNSDNEGDLVEIRQNIVPILEANGVDLVLTGHSHCLERSFLLHGHYGLSGTISEAMKLDGGDGREGGTGAYRKNLAGEGVVYMVAGSSGQATGGQLNHPAHFISLNELGSLVIDVVSNRMDVSFLATNGLARDQFTLLKGALPPVADAGPDQIVECTGAQTTVTLNGTNSTGTALSYQWSENGAALGTNATQPVALGLGTHVITLEVRDPSGAVAQDTVIIAVANTHPPEIQCPGNLVAEFTGTTGAVVHFAVLASADCSPVAVLCQPASGSVFPVGTTRVTCVATDISTNRALCGFSVTVTGARTLLELVLSDLTRLKASVTDKQDSKKLADAIRGLTAALESKRWVDEMHLSTKEGDKEFKEAKESAKKLRDLLRKKKSTVPDAPIESALARMVKAERILAVVVLEEAAAAGAELKKIEDGWKEITQGDADAAKGDDDKAIDHYRQAWKRGTKLLTKVSMHLTAAGANLRGDGVPGEIYVIQASTDLVHWVTLGTVTATPEGVVQFDDPDSARYPSRFYRVIAQ